MISSSVARAQRKIDTTPVRHPQNNQLPDVSMHYFVTHSNALFGRESGTRAGLQFFLMSWYDN